MAARRRLYKQRAETDPLWGHLNNFNYFQWPEPTAAHLDHTHIVWDLEPDARIPVIWMWTAGVPHLQENAPP